MTRPPPLPPDRPAARLDYADAPGVPPLGLDWYAFTRHLIGWAVFGTAVFVLVVFVVPRFEDIFRDFKLDLPAPTKFLLRASRAGYLLAIFAAPLALAHAFAAAALYPRSGRMGRFLYRLMLVLVLGAVVAVVVLALFMPYVAIMEGISGMGPKK